MMNFTRIARVALVIFLAVALIAGTRGVAKAHERRSVDDYELVVGFLVEPAVEGVKNGIDLRVSVPAAEDGGEATPVDGVEQSMQVEITHMPSGISKITELRPIFREPGHYTADLIPTAPGQYRFRFFGAVAGTPIDQTFESGPGRFGDVESALELQFPEQVASPRELESAIKGLQQEIATTQSSATTSMRLALAGLVLGGIGVIAGVAAVVVAARRPRQTS